MITRLIETILPYFVGWAMKLMKLYELTPEQRAVLDEFYLKDLAPTTRRQRQKPVIIALVGLIGSRKSLIANKLAHRIGGTVVEADAIRVRLRQAGLGYEKVAIIAERLAKCVIELGGNAILDSDFIDIRKRASLRALAKKLGAQLIFVRTYCDLDICLGRVIKASDQGDFFEGASTTWNGNKRGAVVKIREMIRRMRLHYKWSSNGGGTWKLEPLPFVHTAINTDDQIGTTHALDYLAACIMGGD